MTRNEERRLIAKALRELADVVYFDVDEMTQAEIAMRLEARASRLEGDAEDDY